MSIESLLLLLVFIILPLLERLGRWIRQRADQPPGPVPTPGERPKPVETSRPAPAPMPQPVPQPAPQPARREAEAAPDRHEPVWNDAEWRYHTEGTGEARPAEPSRPAPAPTRRPPPPPRVPEAPRRQPQTASPGPRPRPGRPGRGRPSEGRPPGVPSPRQAPQPVPAGRQAPTYDTWREAEARTRTATLPVEAGDLTSPASEAVLVSPAARRPDPARQLGLTSRSQLRRAMVLVTVLGPCRAWEEG